MVTLASAAEDPRSNRPGVEPPVSPSGPSSAGHKSAIGSGVDPAELAFLYLVEAAMSSATSALVRAKELNGNALAQEKLNREASGLKWNPIPSDHFIHHHHKHTWTSWHWHWWDPFPVPTHHTHTWTTKQLINGTTIAEVESANQAMFATRGLLENKLTVLQQSASLSQTAISTQSQESMQAMQEGSNIMDILKDLTFKAELRRPPPG